MLATELQPTIDQIEVSNLAVYQPAEATFSEAVSHEMYPLCWGS